MNETMFSLVGMGLILLGVGLLLGGGVSFVTRWQKWSRYRPTEGKIVEVISESVTPGNPYYFPVIEFRLPKGKLVQFKSQVGSYPARPKVGDSVRLLYDPAHPQEAEVDSASAKWFVPTAWVFLGIVTLIIGAMFWYLAA